ncbi:hypothetical protein FGO68_gene883 [Halteria grandinella]|uniref:Uncharacterized protein n=1 Tax=Halteria grandinella TaxID=5974 RepID=A0A8J8NCQ8_HALGN|nr:hypothetical protein FGO68_gene883 [Halteria grandinella]
MNYALFLPQSKQYLFAKTKVHHKFSTSKMEAYLTQLPYLKTLNSQQCSMMIKLQSIMGSTLKNLRWLKDQHFTLRIINAYIIVKEATPFIMEVLSTLTSHALISKPGTRQSSG